MTYVYIKSAHIHGRVSTTDECDDLIKQLQDAKQTIQTGIIARRPKLSDGYIGRDEFYQFMHQFTPKENMRGGTGAKIFGTLLRSVLAEKVGIDIKCSKCHGHVSETCKQTKRRHVDTHHTEMYSISVPSLKSRLNRIRTLEGVTPERYEMITELVKFA